MASEAYKNRLSTSEQAKLLLKTHLSELGIDTEPEFQFAIEDGRRWRFDLASEHDALAFEIEGGAFTRGRHTRGVGFVKDMEKYNAATIRGWRVLRFTPSQVMKGEALEWLKKHLS